MIDIATERLLSLAKAREWLAERTGAVVWETTIYRWIHVGVRGVKLDVARVGVRLYTSIEALQRFSDAIGRPEAAPPAVVSKRRQREIEDANREAERIY